MVDEESVRNRLEVRRSPLGRSAVEAAGEFRWRTHWEVEAKILDRGTEAEVFEIVDKWLFEQTGDEELFGVDKAAAVAYADFLASKGPSVDFDQALSEWRSL
jgi:hypothetical protein